LKAKQTLLFSHFKEYDIIGDDGSTKSVRLCKVVDSARIARLKAAAPLVDAARASGQTALTFVTASSVVVAPAPAPAQAPDPAPSSAPPTQPAHVPAVGPAAADDADAADAADDQFGFAADDGAYIVSCAQEKFWTEEVLPKLPERKSIYALGQRIEKTVGEWGLNGNLLHYPPNPTLNRGTTSLDALCIVPVFVWAPTRAFADIAEDLSPNGQAPCPHGGFNCDVIH
jgi:hypothetical protein